MSELFRRYKQIDSAKVAREAAEQQKRQKQDSAIHEAVTRPAQPAGAAAAKRARSLAVVALVFGAGSLGLGFKLAMDVAAFQNDFRQLQVVVDDRSDEADHWVDHLTAVENEFRRAFKKDRERLDALEKGTQATLDVLATYKDVARTGDIDKISKELAVQKEAFSRLQQRIDNLVSENKKLSEQLQTLQPPPEQKK